MRLYLLRHAEAVDHAASDAARELTALGLAQARMVGAYCQGRGLRPELILASPFRRTVQTADLVAAALGQSTQPAPFLASGMSPPSALAELRAFQRFASVLCVGHEPDLSELAGMLLGLPNPHALPIGKATLIGLEVDRLAPSGARMQFFLPVKLMG